MTRLTKVGWSLIAGVIFSLALGRLLGILELFVFGVAAAAYICLGLLNFLRARSLSAKCIVLPNKIACGEMARIEIQTSFSSHLKGDTLRIKNIYSELGLKDLVISGTSSPITSDYAIQTRKRGLMKFGPLHISLQDPFGITKASKETEARCNLIVHPRTRPLTIPRYNLDGTEEQILKLNKLGSEFHSLREYVPGDDTRLVHWQSSAKYGRLILKHNMKESADLNSAAVFLDNRDNGISEIDFEQMVSAAASLVSALSANGYRVQLLFASEGTGTESKNISNSQNMLDRLALTAQQRGSLFSLKNIKADIFIAIMGNMSQEDESYISRLQISNSSKQAANNKLLAVFGDSPKTHLNCIHITYDKDFYKAWEETMAGDMATSNLS